MQPLPAMTIPVWPLQASGLTHSLSFDGRTIWVFRGKKQINAIDANAVTRLKAKKASRLVNGSVEIHFIGGVAALVIFTRKHQPEFDRLVAAIEAVPPAAAPAIPAQPMDPWYATSPPIPLGPPLVVQESESAQRAHRATYRAMTWAVRLEFASMMLVLVPAGLCVLGGVAFAIYVATR